jgi:hypothetical protein
MPIFAEWTLGTAHSASNYSAKCALPSVLRRALGKCLSSAKLGTQQNKVDRWWQSMEPSDENERFAKCYSRAFGGYIRKNIKNNTQSRLPAATTSLHHHTAATTTNIMPSPCVVHHARGSLCPERLAHRRRWPSLAGHRVPRRLERCRPPCP